MRSTKNLGLVARVLHVLAQWGIEIKVHFGQILCQDRTDEPLVAEQRTANALQRQIRERYAHWLPSSGPYPQ